MKITTILSTSALALLLGMTTSYASSAVAGEDELGLAPTPVPAPAPVDDVVAEDAAIPAPAPAADPADAVVEEDADAPAAAAADPAAADPAAAVVEEDAAVAALADPADGAVDEDADAPAAAAADPAAAVVDEDVAAVAALADPADVVAEEDAAPAADVVEDDGFAGAVAASHKPHKWGDVNGDGKRNLKDLGAWFKEKLDFDGDGDVDFDDVVAGAKALFDKVYKIFDADGDGEVEFDEILVGTHNALIKLTELSDRVLAISGAIQDNPYFTTIPESVKGPLQGLLTIVDKAAGDTQKGINIGGKYIDRIENALKSLKKQIKNLTDGDMSAADVIKARKDIFAYLEMVKGWYNTGDNIKLITQIEEKLAKVKVPGA